MKIELDIKNIENIESIEQADVLQMQQIVEALITTGGLTGVRGGQTIIHFDAQGIFQKVELKYFPWVRRSVDKYKR